MPSRCLSLSLVSVDVVIFNHSIRVNVPYARGMWLSLYGESNKQVVDFASWECITKRVAIRVA